MFTSCKILMIDLNKIFFFSKCRVFCICRMFFFYIKYDFVLNSLKKSYMIIFIDDEISLFLTRSFLFNVIVK